MIGKQYFVYIIINPTKTVLYIGVTNNIKRRLTEHYQNKGLEKTFAGRYNCHFLLHYEIFLNQLHAIQREKEIKGWSRKKKAILIEIENPNWEFLNNTIMPWPPDENLIHIRNY